MGTYLRSYDFNIFRVRTTRVSKLSVTPVSHVTDLVTVLLVLSCWFVQGVFILVWHYIQWLVSKMHYTIKLVLPILKVLSIFYCKYIQKFDKIGPKQNIFAMSVQTSKRVIIIFNFCKRYDAFFQIYLMAKIVKYLLYWEGSV